MSGRRFDRMSKAMAEGTSRRQVLKRLLGGAAGGGLALLGAGGRDALAKRPDQSCCPPPNQLRRDCRRFCRQIGEDVLSYGCEVGELGVSNCTCTQTQ